MGPQTINVGTWPLSRCIGCLTPRKSASNGLHLAIRWIHAHFWGLIAWLMVAWLACWLFPARICFGLGLGFSEFRLLPTYSWLAAWAVAVLWRCCEIRRMQVAGWRRILLSLTLATGIVPLAL